MHDFPVFSVGDEAWTVACDGHVLMVKGMARRTKSQVSESVNSLIPLLALTSATIRRDGNAARLTLRVWDGEEVDVGVIHGGATDVIAGLQAMVTEVARTNVSWPMSSTRAAAARLHLPPGYLRDSTLLGPRGKEEFWSPLSEIPLGLGAEPWQRSRLAGVWPRVAIQATRDSSPVLVALTDDALVLLDREGEVTQLEFAVLGLPEIRPRQPVAATHESLDSTSELGLLVTAPEVGDLLLLGIPTTALQSLYRFLLMRWAETYVTANGSAINATVEASRALNADEIPAVAYAAVLDAAIAASSGVPLSRDFPPRERDYLKPTAAPSPRPIHNSTSTARPTPSAQRPGVNPRQVAAGAAAGAAIWSLFTE